MSPLPFQLLELNVISAQDIAPVSRNLHTYAVTWINPERKLRTRVDQQSQINPTWNDKFVFRVDEQFLDSETSSVMIEIYAQGWLCDIHVGSVRVLIGNLIPLNVRKSKSSAGGSLPSGRPQGILNMGVTLLDNNLKSMPLYSELSASAVGLQELIDGKAHKQKQPEKGGKAAAGIVGKEGNVAVKNLRRMQSDCTDVKDKEEDEERLMSSCVTEAAAPRGSVVNGGSMVNCGSVHGSILNGSMCNSDVGPSPSPSVVAASVAGGLYPTPLPKPHNPGSSILADWTAADDSNTEGLGSKIERWRMEAPGSYDTSSMNSYQQIANKKLKEQRKQQQRHARRHSGDEPSRTFSCFGSALGCEFTIVCGGSGGGRKDSRRVRSHSKIVANSELDSQLVP